MGRLTKGDKRLITGVGALLVVSLCAGVLGLGDAADDLGSPAAFSTTDTAADRAEILGQSGRPATTSPAAPTTSPAAPTTSPAAVATTTKPTPKPKRTPKPKPKPKPKPTKTRTEPAEVYYANCTAVRAAGADPIYRGDPGYSRKLDRDGDGVACES